MSWYDDIDGDVAVRPLTDRMPSPLVIGAAALALLVVIGLALGARTAFTGGAPGTAPTRIDATATGITVVRASGRTETVAAAELDRIKLGRAAGSAATWSAPADGSLIRAEGIRSTTVGGTRPYAATATAGINSATLLDGRIQITGLVAESDARIVQGAARGSVRVRPGLRVSVDGEAVPTTANSQVVVDGVGTLTINEQAVVGNAAAGDDVSGPRYRGVGAAIHLRLTRPAAGLAAGSEIIMGSVDAGVRRALVGTDGPAPVDNPDGDAPTTGGAPAGAVGTPYGGVSLIPGQPQPGASSMPRKAVGIRAGAPGATGSLQGYTHPILGESTWSNDFYGARTTGAHRATDIFATTGTPVVAVTGGVLDRVGWNSLGGHRLWLHDAWGNSFYYAHLSAFSPVARDGAYVQAGEVVGFVGDTGNAKGTPPHLHFEIHDAKGRVRNPFDYLSDWYSGTPIAADSASGTVGLPPVALLGASDISAVSGLVDRGVDHVEPPLDPEAQLDAAVLHG